jgi:hypothetical protein
VGILLCCLLHNSGPEPHRDQTHIIKTHQDSTAHLERIARGPAGKANQRALQGGAWVGAADGQLAELRQDRVNLVIGQLEQPVAQILMYTAAWLAVDVTAASRE